MRGLHRVNMKGMAQDGRVCVDHFCLPSRACQELVHTMLSKPLLSTTTNGAGHVVAGKNGSHDVPGDVAPETLRPARKRSWTHWKYRQRGG